MSVTEDPLVQSSDYDFIAGVSAELYQRRMSLIDYIRLDRSKSIDTLYREQSNPVFFPAIQIHAMVRRPDDSQELNGYGLSRDIAREVYFAKKELDDLALFPTIGDKLSILESDGQNHELEIMVVNKSSSWFLNVAKVNQVFVIARYYRARKL